MRHATCGGKCPVLKRDRAGSIRTSKVDLPLVERTAVWVLVQACGLLGQSSKTALDVRQFRRTLGNLVVGHIWRRRRILRSRTNLDQQCRRIAPMMFAELGGS